MISISSPLHLEPPAEADNPSLVIARFARFAAILMHLAPSGGQSRGLMSSRSAAAIDDSGTKFPLALGPTYELASGRTEIDPAQKVE